MPSYSYSFAFIPNPRERAGFIARLLRRTPKGGMPRGLGQFLRSMSVKPTLNLCLVLHVIAKWAPWLIILITILDTSKYNTKYILHT